MSEYRVLLLFVVSCLVYIFVGRPLPSILDGTWIGNHLIFLQRCLELIKNVSLGTIASCIFYYFIVHIPEQKQISALDKVIEEKIALIYDQSVGVAWTLVSTHQLRGQGIDVQMSEAFIREWVDKTNVTQPEHSRVPQIMYDHWFKAKSTSNELSGIITQNIALTDHNLLAYLKEIENTDFKFILDYRNHPQGLKVVEERIIDLYNKGEALKKYYISNGGTMESM